MSTNITIAILEDHQSIIDGYMMRFREATGIELAGIAGNGEEMIELLTSKPQVNVLIMDVNVPAAPDSKSNIPILHYVPKLIAFRPNLNILIISVHDEPSLVEALINAGISGYIFKKDSASILKLPMIVRKIADGSTFFSDDGKEDKQNSAKILTRRQLEVISLCAEFPDDPAGTLALELGIASSTFRNLLSEIYERLEVRTKAAAISRARTLGLIP